MNRLACGRRVAINSADDQPFSIAKPELPGIAVVAIVAWADDVEQVGENVVVDALLGDPGDDLAAGNIVTTAIECLGMKAPGFAAADRPLKDIDRPVLLGRAHGKSFSPRAKIEPVRHCPCLD